MNNHIRYKTNFNKENLPLVQIGEEVTITANTININLKYSIKFINKGTIEITFSETEDADEFSSEVSSILSQKQGRGNSLRAETDNVYKLVHEAVAMLISSSKTDVKLSSVYENLEYGDFTPDFLFKDQLSNLVWVELGTTTGNISRLYDDKYDLTRSKLEINGLIDLIGIIAVGGSQIRTNILINQQEADRVVSLYSFMRKVTFEICQDYSFPYMSEQVDNEEIKTIMLSMSDCIPDEADLPLISKRTLDFWMSSNINRKEIELKILREITKEYQSNQTYNHILAAKEDILKFELDYSKFPRRDIYDMKSIFPIPFVITNNDYSDTVDKVFILENVFENHPLERLWRSAFIFEHDEEEKRLIKLKTDGIIDRSINNEETIDSETQWTSKAKDYKLNPEYVKIKFDEQLTTMVQERGIFGKKLKGSSMEENKKLEGKKCFDLFAHTKDIKTLIDNEEIMFEYQDNFSNSNLAELKELANIKANGRKETVADKDILEFRSTKIGSYLELVDKIAQELNLCLSKKLEKNQFILKQILTGVYLLVKTVSVDKHIFYSLMILNELVESENTCFPKYEYRNEVFSFYNFRSTNRDKLSNWLGCFQTSCLTHTMWSMLFKYKTEMLQECRRMTLFNIMCIFEDKQTTTDLLQNIRYSYMSVCSGQKPNDNPFKILSKLGQFRSRLASFIYQHFKQNFIIMNNLRPRRHFLKHDKEMKDATCSTDQWENLKNFITGTEIESFEIACNLSYLGSFHNKDEREINQSYYSIYTKIISQELLMKKTRKEMMGLNSVSDSKDLRDHEFDASIAIYTGDLIKESLNKTFGEDLFEAELYRSIKKILDKSYLEFATFKASAVETSDPKYDTSKTYHNVKAIEAIVDLFIKMEESSLCPLDQFKILLDILNKRGVFASTFIKNQLTGVREIFILDIISRILINFVEEIGVFIGKQLDNEMMTKGTQKANRMKSFKTKVKANMFSDSEVLISTESADASTWCQRFVMSYFSCVYSRFLPKEVIVVMSAILNCVTNKRILLPQWLLTKFVHSPETLSFKEEINVLKNQFLGKSEDNDIINKGEIFLKNKSNFMQGILGQTAGICHSGMQLIMREVDNRILSIEDINNSISPFRFVQIDLNSSDDSTKKRAIIVKKNNQGSKNIARGVLELMSFSSDVVLRFSGCKLSKEKSTRDSREGVTEFNSDWDVGNTTVRMIIKMVAVMFKMTATFKMNDRFEKFSNLRKTLLEFGGDSYLVEMCQKLQLEIHYNTIGNSTNQILFDTYKTLLLEKPHPSVGFFCCEPICIAGLLGHDYAFYKLYKETKETRMINNFFLSKKMLVMQEETDISTPNIIIKSSRNLGFIGFRERMKAKLFIGSEFENKSKIEQMLEKAKDFNIEFFYDIEKSKKFTQEDIKKIENSIHLGKPVKFEVDPRLLYLGPESRSDMAFLLRSKSLMSSAEPSFIFDKKSRVYALSAHMLYNPVVKIVKHEREFSMKTLTFESIKKCKAMSLIRYVNSLEKYETENTMEHIDIIFKRYRSYELVDALYKDVSDDFSYRYLESSRSMIQFEFHKANYFKLIPLKKCVIKKWFGKEVRVSNTLLEHSWSKYKNLYKWLDEEYEETFKKSPFETHESMASFIETEVDYNSVPEILSDIKAKDFRTMINDHISRFKRHFKHGLEKGRTVKPNGFDEKLNFVVKTFTSHLNLEEKIGLIKKLELTKEDVDQLSTMSKTGKKLSIVINFILNPDKRELINQLKLEKEGKIYYFPKPQRRNKEGEWKGHGLMELIINGIMFNIRVFDDNAVIETTNRIYTDIYRKEIVDILLTNGYIPYQSENFKINKIRSILTEQDKRKYNNEEGFDIEEKRNLIMKETIIDQKIEVETHSSMIRIVIKPLNKPKQTILSLSLDSLDVRTDLEHNLEVEQITDIEQEFAKIWVEGKQIPLELFENMSDEVNLSDTFKEWLVWTLDMKMKNNKPTLSINILDKTLEKDDFVEKTDGNIEQFKNILATQIELDTDIDLDLLENDSEEDSVMDLLEVDFAAEYDIFKYNSYAAKCKYWDLILQEFKQTREYAEFYTSNYKVTKIDESKISWLLNLLGNSERKLTNYKEVTKKSMIDKNLVNKYGRLINRQKQINDETESDFGSLNLEAEKFSNLEIDVNSSVFVQSENVDTIFKEDIMVDLHDCLHESFKETEEDKKTSYSADEVYTYSKN